MLFRITEKEQSIFNKIKTAAQTLDIPVYIVGGYVRDKLLGRSSKDIDVVCVGDGITLAEEVARNLSPRPFVVVYQRFGTAMFKHEGIEIEFVGARKESYSADSRKPSVARGTLEDDQNRRDFTINALAVSINEDNYGEIIDSFDGFKDLENKIIRTPLAPDRTFSDDPLRMLRAIRFSTQLDFSIDPSTLASISRNKDRLHIISKERITDELNKIIKSPIPSIGFKLLFDTGLLHIILPELCALQGVEIINNIGHKDNFYHTLEVLDNIAQDTNDLWLRWAALLHDIAKPPTKRFDAVLGWTFHGHETLGAIMVSRIFKKLKLPLDNKMKFVQKMVQLHLRPIALTNDKVTDSAVRRLLFDAGEDIDALMLLCKADITSKNEGKIQRYKENYQKLHVKLKEVEEKDQLRMWQPPLSGEDIMKIFGMSPSREVGILKNAIKEAVLEGEVENTYESAYKFIIQKAAELGIRPIQNIK